MKNYTKTLSWSLFAAFLLVITACVKREFDAPPITGGGEELTPTMTIKALKALSTTQFVTLSNDDIIGGTVIMNDSSGNYYKTIVIQDATGGIEIKINSTGLYTNYELGRTAYVKVKGLILGNYNGVLQLGGSIGTTSVNGIETALMDKFLVRGKFAGVLEPKVRTIAELNTDDISTLVKINEVQFAANAVGVTYADVAGAKTLNLNLENCDQETIILRTSNFSDFAAAITPDGKGSVVALYGVFKDDKQLFIRHANDISFAGNRCGGGSGTEELMSIADLRALYTGTDVNVPANKKIKGVVISDVSTNMVTSKNCVIQEIGGAGITIRFSANNTLAIGDLAEVVVSGAKISKFQGLLQIEIDNAAAKKVGTGAITPKELTLAQINTQFDNIESQLVKIKDVTFSKSSGGTFSGNTTLTDASGTLAHYTPSYATFSGSNFPTDKVTITALLTRGSASETKQASIRNLNDIEGGIVNPGGDELLNVNFSGQTVDQPVNLAGWLNVAETGSRTWLTKSFSGSNYAQATSFNASSDLTGNIMWLVTPELTLDKAYVLTFQSANAYWKHNGMEVLISTNFSGGNPWSATWTALPCTLAGETAGNYTWVNSGDVDLSSLTGSKVRIAFKYTGDYQVNTTTYQVSNILVKKK